MRANEDPRRVLVALLLGVTAVPRAGAAVLCVRKSGVVMLRTACKKKEHPLDLGAFLTAGAKGDPEPKGDPGAQGDPGPKGDPGGLAVSCATQVGTEVFFTGCNVNIQNGSGSTDGPTNGLGNLVVGYNANTGGSARTGSHNLIVGDEHEYVSYGGLLSGSGNAIAAPWAVALGTNNVASGTGATVTGGAQNTASGDSSAVSGGSANKASETGSAVSGGNSNVASGTYSAVSGGGENTASENRSAVSGGLLNTASADSATASGGFRNTASGGDSWVGGGSTNTASQNAAAVSGGRNNTASGTAASVGGGDGVTEAGNEGFAAGGTGAGTFHSP